MPIQANLQWTDFLLCPICQHDFTLQRSPISLGCGHTICKLCLATLHRKQCPFDQTAIITDIDYLPVNSAILQLISDKDTSSTPTSNNNNSDKAAVTTPSTSKSSSSSENLASDDVPDVKKSPEDAKSDEDVAKSPPIASSIQKLSAEDLKSYNDAKTAIEELALYLKPYINGGTGTLLSRPMIRKLVTLVNCQLMEDEGKIRSLRAARSLGERTVTELILQHQNPQQLSTNLWAAVRARGCQFLGPAMQEEVLKLVLQALEDGSALSRKVLVMFVVQRLEPHFHQASKTSIGHVVQLLYRASCFKVSKREGDSSLMQLKEEYRTYEALRREHDAQIVQIATEAGLRIAPDQWSSLLYGDTAHKSHMQSIIDKLQTPQSFEQSVQELFIALQRTGDPANLSGLRTHLNHLSGIDPVAENTVPSLNECATTLDAVRHVVQGLVEFVQQHGNRKLQDTSHVLQNSKYKISYCRDLKIRGTCPRAGNCTFAHSEDELERYRAKVKKLPLRATASTPKETIEYLGDPIGRSGSFGEEHSPLRYAKSNVTSRFAPTHDKVGAAASSSTAGMGSHPPLLPHLSLPANPAAAMYGNGPMMSPQMTNRFPPAAPPPPYDPSSFPNANYLQQRPPMAPNLRNFRPPPPNSQQNPPPVPPNMYGANKMTLTATPSAPPQYFNDFYNNLMQHQQAHGVHNPGGSPFSQANPFIKQLQNAHEYPLDKLDQRKLELIRQIIEWEQQAVNQQQQAQQQKAAAAAIPNKIPVKSTQSLPMYRTSPENMLNLMKESQASNIAMHLQSLMNRKREIMQEIETHKELFGTNSNNLDHHTAYPTNFATLQDQVNGNIFSNPSKKNELLDFWGFSGNSNAPNVPPTTQNHHHPAPAYQIDTMGVGSSTNKDTFVRSDSILDDDYVPFETTATTSSKFGPISRMPSNPLKQQHSLTGLDTLINSQSLNELSSALHASSSSDWLSSNNNNNSSASTSPITNLYSKSTSATATGNNHVVASSSTNAAAVAAVQDAIIKLMSPTVQVSKSSVSSSSASNNVVAPGNSQAAAMYLKRLTDNNQLQLELSRVDHKIAGLRQSTQQQQQQQVHGDQKTNEQQQPQIPQKRKLTRLVGGLGSDLHNPLTKAASFSSGQQSTTASANPLSSSSSLFWNETDLMNAKLWGGTNSAGDNAANLSTKSLKNPNKSSTSNNNSSSNSSTGNNNNSSSSKSNGNNVSCNNVNNNNNDDDSCDEEGIANGIREIEIRFENELEEQEKLWPDPENLA
ncbi:roquin-1 [Culicoides brevitarsis]|uniref:roquin-1 n=1 Tax=Culicoides brevitarsis TaxID=469753 RepID=UPI00307C80B7